MDSQRNVDIGRALEHHRAGRYIEAFQIYEQLLEAEPDDADVLHFMGQLACRLGEADLAISLISRASRLFPENAAYLNSLGMVCREKGSFDLSLSCYARALELEPGSASAWFGTGNTQQSQGMLADAMKSFAMAIELSPDFVEARYNLANIERSLGRYADAIENYRVAIMAKPDFADAHHNMGSAFYSLGRLDEALACYEHALPHNLPETHNNIGNILVDKGQPELALASYRRAVAAKADYAGAYDNIGTLLRKSGKFEEAVVAFNEALRLAPAYASTHFNLGSLLSGNGLFAESVRHFEDAIELAPDMVEAHFELGIARSHLNELTRACACFEQVMERRPDHVNAIYNLGVTRGRLSQLIDAERCYRQVLVLDPAHVDAHINLSAILTETDRPGEARQHMDFAYSRQNLFEKYSSVADKTVLILFDAGKGNVNLTHLFNEKTCNIIDWMIGYAPENQASQLPAYDIVFNAMGDADLTGEIAAPVGRFLGVCTKPLLNHPDKVARTARNKLPALLDGIDGLLVPQVWRFASNDDWDESVEQQLPLLIRPVHTQGGIGMVQANTPLELAQFKALQAGPVYVSRFVDYRSADRYFRKYRMIFIDRKPYPYHLAISPNWMVHYYTAGMEDVPAKLEEEKAFLESPVSALGSAGMRALELIGMRLDLDYAGIDFSIMPDGRILVFEANPTMLVHPESIAGPLAHKNVYVRRILDAFEDRLNRSVTP